MMDQNKLKNIFFLSFLTLAIFIISSNTQALIAPQVYLTELNLSKISFEPGEEIQGSVSLWNYENFIISDLRFHFQLLGKEINGVPTEMIDEKIGQEIFSLSTGEKVTKSFTYFLPANLPKGDFKFRVQLATSRGEEMGWIDRTISIGGEGKFLTLDNYWIVRDGQKLSPGAGVYYQPGEIPEIVFDVTNNSGFTIIAFPKIITYKRNVGEEIQKTQEEKSIILKPGEKQTLKINLPQLEKPDTYLSEVRFYETDNLEPISNSVSFRWIISGEDAEILFVNLNKDSYESGEEAQVQIQFTGPADFRVEGGQGCIQVNLFDQEGNSVGQTQDCRQLKPDQILVKVPLKEKVDNPKTLVQIVKEDKILDQYQFQTRPPELEEVVEEEKEPGFLEKNKNLIIFLLVIILIASLIIYYLRTKKMRQVKSLIWLILLGAGILFADSTLAANEVVDGPPGEGNTVIFNSPLPNQVFKPGDLINFSGKYRITSCADGLFYNKIVFFITEDKEIPIKTAPNYCQDCGGATSQTYGTCLQNIGYCSQVQVLDTSQPGYKIYKLGTIFPSDVASGAKSYWVEYNQNFTIPSDLGFSGPVRFYVQYSGTHWNEHWHWNITYQKGYINSPANKPVSTKESWNHCGIQGLSIPTFHWTYSDSDGDPQAAYQIKIYGQTTLNQTVNCYSPPCLSYTPTSEWIRNNLNWGKTYNWQVRVKDNQGNWSAWSDLNPFTLPTHAYPWPDFTHSPQNPVAGEEVEFTDNSQCYSFPGNIEYNCKENPNNRYQWDFEDDGIIDCDSNLNPDCRGDVTYNYPTSGNYTVRLFITDELGTCNGTGDTPITIEIPLPEWKEIPPF